MSPHCILHGGTKKCTRKNSRRYLSSLFRQVNPIRQFFPDWGPINFANPDDVAVNQKVLGIKGAAKVWKIFCHCCSLTSADIVEPNENLSSTCQIFQSTNSGWKCYCQTFSSE